MDALAAPRRRSLPARVRPHRHDRRAGRARTARRRRRSSRRRASRRRPAGASSPSAASARPTSWCSPTAARGIQVYIRQDSVAERDFQVFKLLDLGDFVGVRGHLFRTKTNEFTIWASRAHVPGQVPPAAAGEVARPAGRRDPLPPALPRPDRQPGLAPRVRGAEPGARRDPRLPERARLPRGRDADDAADRGRRAGAAVRHAPQRARHATCTCASRRSCT